MRQVESGLGQGCCCMVRLRLLRFGVPFPGQARAVASLASCSGSGLREAEAKLGGLRVELTATIAPRTTLDKRRKTISLYPLSLRLDDFLTLL